MKALIPLIVLMVSTQACQQNADTATKEARISEGYFSGQDDVQLFYRIIGSAPDTVFVLHGGPGCDMEYLIPDMEPLAREHTVVYYDQLGAGKSQLPLDETQLTIDHYVQDLDRLRSFLGMSKVTLIGHSFGSLLANYYMRDYPENVERAILIGGLPPQQGDFGKRYVENLNAKLTDQEQIQMQELNKQMRFIHGEAEAIPMDMMEEWTTVLPNARLLRIADAAHFPYIEKPAIVWPAIEVFLKGEWPEAVDSNKPLSLNIE